MMTIWSDHLRLMARPFRVYRELAAAGAPTARETAREAVFPFFVFGGVLSFGASGRLVALHVASGLVMWLGAPLSQALALAVVARLFAPRCGLARAAALYYLGYGPWLLFALLVAGICLFSPDVHGTLTTLLEIRVLPALLAAVVVWSALLTFACFTAGLGLSKGRAVFACALFYAICGALQGGAHLAQGQVLPMLPGGGS